MEEWKLLLFLFCLLISFDFIKGDCTTSEAGRYEFGQNCGYLCRCKYSDERCNQTTGECSSGCQNNWMGPACQYLNIAPRSSNTMYDNDETTCSPTSSSKDIDLGGVYPFNTITVVFDRTRIPITICVRRVQSGNWDSCVDTTESTAGSLHAVFENIIQARYVRLEIDDFSAAICEIKVTGGRNLAYKQLATQSSNFTDNGGTAMNGVDGTAGNGKYAGSEAICIQTTDEVNPWWKVHLDSLYTIVSFRMFNWLVEDCNPCSNWLVNFTLSLSNSSEAIDIVELYRDQRPTLHDEAKLTVITNITILQGRYVYVKRSGNLKAPLTFCEIQILGDCPNNKCGLSCTENCFCKAATYVNKLNGLCYGGCQPGWRGNDLRCNEICAAGKYGHNCLLNCGNCSIFPCNHVNGKCTDDKCKAGYRGDYCKQPCAAGKYGDDCLQECGRCSIAPCNHVDGTCTDDKCEAGYRGPYCKQPCAAGKYGHKCLLDCGNCSISPCNRVDGRCTNDKCTAGYAGPYCNQPCASGKYGDNCSQECGNCSISPCNHVDGKCTDDKCKAGYRGDHCKQLCTAGKYGDNCSQECGNCRIPPCNHVDGKCTDDKCAAGYRGDYCKQPCAPGKYGYNCLLECGYCSIIPCNHVDGLCTDDECGAAGYRGPYCIQHETQIDPKEQTTSTPAIVGGVVAAVLVVICGVITFVILRRRKRLCESPIYEDTHRSNDEHQYYEIGNKNVQCTAGSASDKGVIKDTKEGIAALK